METGNTTQTQNAALTPEIIANRAIGYLGAYLSLGANVVKDAEITAQKVGDKIRVPKRGTIYAQQKAEGTTRVVQKPSMTEIDVDLDQHWYVALLEEDFTRALQTESGLPGYVEDSLAVLAEKIESTLAAHYSEFSNIDQVGTAAGDAYKSLVNARTQLANQKVPKILEKFGYISPRFAGRLLKEEQFVDPKTDRNTQASANASLGRLGGFTLDEGQLVPTAGSPAWDQNIFYTKFAMVLATRSLRIPSSNMGVEATTVGSDAGVSMRYVRAWDKDEMGEVVQLDVLFGTAVNDVNQGTVLETQ